MYLGIGVEHEVLATNLSMWDSEPMLVAAANLCLNVCNRRAIPKLRRVTNGDAGIYGHSDVRATDLYIEIDSMSSLCKPAPAPPTEGMRDNPHSLHRFSIFDV